MVNISGFVAIALTREFDRMDCQRRSTFVEQSEHFLLGRARGWRHTIWQELLDVVVLPIFDSQHGETVDFPRRFLGADHSTRQNELVEGKYR